MVKFHQDAALDLLYKNFTTNIEDYLAWKAKWIKNRKLIYPLNQDIKEKLTPFIKKTNQAFRRYIPRGWWQGNLMFNIDEDKIKDWKLLGNVNDRQFNPFIKL